MSRIVKLTAAVFAIVLATILGVRAFDSQRGPPLRLWHTHVPNEPGAADIARFDWDAWLAAEAAVFREVRAEVTERLPPEDRVAANRYYDGSPLHPGRFARDWNRSFVMIPDGPPAGAVVLLHGLTDSPYSVRRFAALYRDRGFVAVAIRLPGHGTVPAGLATARWEDWSEATRLAVREALEKAGPGRPLHLVGYSNGGALAMKYALDALEDPTLVRPSRIVLISPMIGVTSLARFAGVVGWPAVFPAFAKAAWLGIVPEFNPFKYNSFPVNAARQSSLLSRALQTQVAQRERDGRLALLAPILAFQSVVDFTVSTRAIVDALFARLPANGSELVLFDLNRHARFGPLLRASAETELARVLPSPPRAYTATVIATADPSREDVVERVTAAGGAAERTRPLGLAFPRDVFSLSHIALPFPIDDPLYGLSPDPGEDFGVNLGAMATRGERGTLVLSIDALNRMSSNPFFSYVLERIAEGLPAPSSGPPSAPAH